MTEAVTFTVSFDVSDLHAEMVEQVGEEQIEAFLEAQLSQNGGIEDIIHNQFVSQEE